MEAIRTIKVPLDFGLRNFQVDAYSFVFTQDIKSVRFSYTVPNGFVVDDITTDFHIGKNVIVGVPAVQKDGVGPWITEFDAAWIAEDATGFAEIYAKNGEYGYDVCTVKFSARVSGRDRATPHIEGIYAPQLEEIVAEFRVRMDEWFDALPDVSELVTKEQLNDAIAETVGDINEILDYINGEEI